jgi:hypothetical protein
MAAEGDTQEEMRFHAKSYSAFATMMKWGTILSAIVALFVILMISN